MNMLNCNYKTNGSYAKNSKEVVMERITVFLVGLLQFVHNQWLRFVGWLKFLGEVTIHEPDVKVGDVAINPRWTWVKVKNPKGRRNGNSFHDFGDSAGIKEGGKLTAVAIENGQVLVSYESPKGQGFGSEAGNGTLFFVPKSEFRAMTAAYQTIQTSKGEEKARILALLRGSYESESSSS